MKRQILRRNNSQTRQWAAAAAFVEKRAKRTGGRHNFHLGKLPATIKIQCVQTLQNEREGERKREGAFFSLSIMIHK